jgi:16S rRNA processing protein RimM
MGEGWDDMVVVGSIARPHGLRGHVIVQPETDFPQARFRAGGEMHYRAGAGGPPRILRVKDARRHTGRLLVLFEGVETVGEAEMLGRGELRVPADELTSLPPGHFYHHELVGCEVVALDGERIGVVRQVDDMGSVRLVVQGPRGEVLVPLVADICVGIDTNTKRIVVAPPEGLLDLNASR